MKRRMRHLLLLCHCLLDIHEEELFHLFLLSKSSIRTLFAIAKAFLNKTRSDSECTVLSICPPERLKWEIEKSLRRRWEGEMSGHALCPLRPPFSGLEGIFCCVHTWTLLDLDDLLFLLERRKGRAVTLVYDCMSLRFFLSVIFLTEDPLSLSLSFSHFFHVRDSPVLLQFVLMKNESSSSILSFWLLFFLAEIFLLTSFFYCSLFTVSRAFL